MTYKKILIQQTQNIQSRSPHQQVHNAGMWKKCRNVGIVLAREQGDMFCVPEKVSPIVSHAHTHTRTPHAYTVTEDVVVHDMDNISVGLVDGVAVCVCVLWQCGTIE